MVEAPQAQGARRPPDSYGSVCAELPGATPPTSAAQGQAKDSGRPDGRTLSCRGN